MDMNRANSRREWRTGEPGVLQFMQSQRARHGSAMEQACWMTHNSVAVCTLVFRAWEARCTLEEPATYLPFSQRAQFQNPLFFHLENHWSTKFLLMIWHSPQVKWSRKKHLKTTDQLGRGKNTLQLSDGEKEVKTVTLKPGLLLNIPQAWPMSFGIIETEA